VTPRRVAILGLGLMGGSLGLALRALDDPPHVLGFDAAPDAARRARERGAADEIAAGAADAAASAELLLLAVPPRAAIRLLDSVAPRLGPGTVVADLSSVMAETRRWAADHPGLDARVVSSHPLCGSERSGIEAARPDLYRGRSILLGASDGAGAAVARVADLWRSVGAEPRPIEPALHDALLALTSHLPEALAAVSGPGLRDATRLAGSLPSLWGEILSLNAAEVLPALRRLEAEIGVLRRALEQGEPEVRKVLAEAAAFRAVLVR
jgi:prephenate dehydrogenase